MLSYSVTVSQCYIIVQRYITVVQGHSVNFQCYSVTVLPCSVTVSQCYITVVQGHSLTLQCYSVQVLQYSVTV